MGPVGHEPGSAGASGRKHLRASGKSGGAESGADSPKTPCIDPELAKVIDAWPMLPEAIRAGIVAMVKAACGEPGRSARTDHADSDGGKGQE